MAMQVVSRIREVFGIDISVRRLFECPEIATLAEAIDQSFSAGSSTQTPALQPAEKIAAPPLSFAQLRLWFLQQFESASSVYNVPLVLHLRGDLKPGLLEQSITEIVSRHESLRTTFTGDVGNPSQIVHPATPVCLPIVDLRGLDRISRQQTVQSLIEEQSQARFDLTQGPLLRLKLVRSGPEEYLLLLTMHHIVSDGWSLAIFTRELAAIYQALLAGENHRLPALPVQYVDFAIWQKELLKTDALKEQMSYWRKQLEGMPGLLSLPAADT